MARHFVIMSSSYTNGERIAIDYTGKQASDTNFIMQQIDKIKEACGEDVPISIHSVQTQTDEWSSLINADGFFRDVKVVDIDKFTELINQDRILKGIDVAKYILSIIKCTHLKLEKLVYLCYAEYLEKTGQKLFKDEIYAFRYGPVVQTVYDRYKGYGREKLEDEELIPDDRIQEMPSRSRIIFAKDGNKKVQCIDLVIKKYGDYSASDLVGLTHKEGAPWSRTFCEEGFTLIDDKTILKYHKVEK